MSGLFDADRILRDLPPLPFNLSPTVESAGEELSMTASGFSESSASKKVRATLNDVNADGFDFVLLFFLFLLSPVPPTSSSSPAGKFKSVLDEVTELFAQVDTDDDDDDDAAVFLVIFWPGRLKIETRGALTLFAPVVLTAIFSSFSAEFVCCPSSPSVDNRRRLMLLDFVDVDSSSSTSSPVASDAAAEGGGGGVGLQGATRFLLLDWKVRFLLFSLASAEVAQPSFVVCCREDDDDIDEIDSASFAFLLVAAAESGQNGGDFASLSAKQSSSSSPPSSDDEESVDA